MVGCFAIWCGQCFAEENTATAENTAAPEYTTELKTPSAAELEAAGAIIGEIVIINGDVFDTSLPEEDKSLFRLANKLHIETRPETVRSQLLFHEGERFSGALLHESERILRANSYMFDARIEPIAYHDGRVDIEVRTRDVWTLKPGFNFGRKGGENESGLEFEESNLLGLGKEIELSYSKDVDRDSMLLRYKDPHLFSGWNRLQAAYSDNSDGKLRAFSLDRPFYSLHAPWTAGAGIQDWQRIDSRYNLGKVVDKFNHDEQEIEMFVNRTGERIFDGDNRRSRAAVLKTSKDVDRARTGHNRTSGNHA